LAYADCSEWAEVDYSVDPLVCTPGRRLNRAALGGVGTMVVWSSPGGGMVLTAPVTDWPRALVDFRDYAAPGTPLRISPASLEARVITGNVLYRLGGVLPKSRQ
jgi:hypothetical protein